VNVAVSFYLDSQIVGDFSGSSPPLCDGEYAYVPHRGPGHVNLMNQLMANHTPRCHYLLDGTRIEFSVVAHVTYGKLRVAGFEESSASAS
jgi:hypothetical protein